MTFSLLGWTIPFKHISHYRCCCMSLQQIRGFERPDIPYYPVLIIITLQNKTVFSAYGTFPTFFWSLKTFPGVIWPRPCFKTAIKQMDMLIKCKTEWDIHCMVLYSKSISESLFAQRILVMSECNTQKCFRNMNLISEAGCTY